MQKSDLKQWVVISIAAPVTFIGLPLLVFLTSFTCCGAPAPSGFTQILGITLYWSPLILAAGLLYAAVYFWNTSWPARAILIALACINMWPAVLAAASPFLAAYTTQQNTEALKQQEAKERERLYETQQEAKLERQLVANGCNTARLFSIYNYPQRIEFYFEKLHNSSTKDHARYTNELQALIDQARKDCASGKITAAEQRTIVDVTVPETIIKYYINAYGEAKFQEFDTVFKDQQAKDPTGRWY